MKIVRLARRMPPCTGGQEQHVARLSAEQGNLGGQNWLIFAEGQPGSGYQWTKVPSVAGIPTDYGKGCAFSAQAAMAYAFSVAREMVPDVVHSHGTAGDLFGLVAVGPQSAKRFHTFHASLVFPRHVRSTYGSLLRRLDAIFTVSALIKDQLQSVIRDLPPVYVFSSAVDPGLFEIIPADRPSRLLMVGRLVPFKGFDVGIKAAAVLYRRGVISGVDIAGDGPEAGRLRTLALAEKLSVTFHGHVGKPVLGELLRHAAVLLCPSRTLPGQAEGTPTVILEAWATGVPVVASASGGITALIEHGADGFLVPEGDASALAEGTLIALSRKNALSRNGRRRVAGYTWKHLACQVMEVYREHGA